MKWKYQGYERLRTWRGHWEAWIFWSWNYTNPGRTYEHHPEYNRPTRRFRGFRIFGFEFGYDEEVK